MKNQLKQLKSFFATTLRLPFLYSLCSYSQEGEDILLRKIFDGQKNGFYVDIGAHHPYRYSNTQYFYQLGWIGINVDATPSSMNEFKKVRTKDINLECIVSSKTQTLSYYIFQDSALNTFSKKRADDVTKSQQSTLIETVQLQSKTLKDILLKHVPHNTKIDFLSIDVEGAELEVLNSNDWKKFAPKIIVVEILSSDDIKALESHPVSQFLKKQDYQLFARGINSTFFRKVKAK